MSPHSRINDRDQSLLSRLVDGQCSELEQRSVQARLEQEPALAAALEQLEGTRTWFGQARAGEPAVAVPLGFADKVLGKVRRLPDPESLAAIETEVGMRATHFARRLTVAALVVLGAALLFSAGLWTASDARVLEASPAEIERAMQELDSAIDSGALGASDLDRSRGR